MAFTVKTGEFEGPLDLLLDLVERRKLFVGEVSLGQVTDDYLAYMQELSQESMDDRTAFLIVAATLILVKSRVLLPNLNLTQEEETEVAQLAGRLERYEAARIAGRHIADRYGKIRLHAAPSGRLSRQIRFRPDARLSGSFLRDAMDAVMNNAPKPEPKLPQVTAERAMSIEEMIGRLEERISVAVKTSFRSVAGHKAVTREERVFVIVSFLAMLEMIRQGLLAAEQQSPYEDISLEAVSSPVQP